MLHPDESFHLREIARATNTQPGTLRRELAQLTDAGVLSREKLGNLVRYKADPACPKTPCMTLEAMSGVWGIRSTGMNRR